jgi:polyhydroxyalkanoate synthesis regulator phasin
MEKIEDLFKKFVYTGVGLAAMTGEKLKKAVDELIKDEKISTKEGEKIVKDFVKSTESKSKELEEDLKKAVNKVIDKLNFAKKPRRSKKAGKKSS